MLFPQSVSNAALSLTSAAAAALLWNEREGERERGDSLSWPFGCLLFFSFLFLSFKNKTFTLRERKRPARPRSVRETRPLFHVCEIPFHFYRASHVFLSLGACRWRFASKKTVAPGAPVALESTIFPNRSLEQSPVEFGAWT